jgi:group I intron endonuclease
MAQHKHNALVKGDGNSLYKAIRKYGWENFTKEIITHTDTEETAQLLEETLIREMNSVKKGYNDTYVGGGGNLYKDQPEKLERLRKKMSFITAGKKNGMFGKKQTEEAKQKQREKAKGRFSLQWYVDRYGDAEGTCLYKERSEKLKQRNLQRSTNGTFTKGG